MHTSEKEVQNGTVTSKPILKFLLRLINNDPAIVLLNIYARKIKTCSYQDLYKHVHSTFFNFSKKNHKTANNPNIYQ